MHVMVENTFTIYDTGCVTFYLYEMCMSKKKQIIFFKNHKNEITIVNAHCSCTQIPMYATYVFTCPNYYSESHR